ncbi:enoyl-CoA-hydratase DpgD [Serratia rhizosphaerae]|uniref:Enoyl-CoA hydratase n=1 Tax=Serratia rhizosphaerae TaxID=2597702 RepID=A0ABX6GSV7_9GAMM|nr:enoyl-CoA-hydratase DpgD [Serratia rhizosphaerae]QHA89378.1 enoyl-CoA hydratase [Serratia rhizosphaerae]
MAERDNLPPAVLYEKRGHVAYITLNRPAVLNAMNLDMHRQLLTVWEDFNHDDELWVAVLAGAGGKSFSVGQDLKELKTRYADGEPFSSLGSAGRPGWPRLTERTDIYKPIIAVVEGYAFGGGFELALACDLIVASEASVFALPEAKLGLIQGAGGIFRLTRQMPMKLAMEMLLTGKQISARQAQAFGIVNQVVDGAKLVDTVEQLVNDILRCSPAATRAIKNIAYDSADKSLPEAFQTQYAAEQRRLHSQDLLEGVDAFLEKRPPVWSGT